LSIQETERHDTDTMPKEGGAIPEAQKCDVEATIRAALVCYGRMYLSMESNREDLEKIDTLSSMFPSYEFVRDLCRTNA